MKSPYWDTSCVLALYVTEPLSKQIAACAAQQRQALTSSVVLEYEMTLGLHAKEARGEILPGTAGLVLEKFRSDLKKDRFLLLPLGKDVGSRAAGIAEKILRANPPLPLRTLDGIHLATALQLQCSEMITTDKRQADAARLLGLSVQDFY